MASEYPDQKQRTAICYGSWDTSRDKGNKSGGLHTRTKLNTLQVRADLLRTEKLNGKEHLVAPVVCIVEGVHNHEFLSYEEIVIFPESWDGRPLPIDHPTDNDGHAVTANSPNIIESSVVGYLFNVVARDDIRGISGEIWIDIEKAGTVPGGDEVLNRLNSGKQLEVSTAYYTLVDNTPGEWHGPSGAAEKYTESQYGLRPDHLALLPFDTGACDWKDGCGTPRLNSDSCDRTDPKPGDHTVNSSDMPVFNIRDSARRPSFSGTETSSWAGVDKSFAAYAAAYLKSTGSSDDAPSGVKDAPSGMKSWIASKTLLGDAAAETTKDLIFFPVVNPGTGKLNKGALRAVISGRGSQADIPASTLKSAQTEARSLLKSEFGESQSENNDLEENTEDSLMKDNKLQINGKQLGRVLSGALETHIGTDGTPTEMIHRLAVAANIDSTKVQNLLDGALDYAPRAWLNIFAAVLDIDPWELFTACGNDNSDARYPTNTVSVTIPENRKKESETETGVTDTKQETLESQKSCVCERSLKVKVQEIVTNTLNSIGIRWNKSGDKVMNKQERIEALIASNETQFSENHREWLMTLSDDQLAVLEPKVASGSPAATIEAVSTVAANTAAVETKETVKPVSKEQILEALGVDEEVLETAKAAHAQKKQVRANRISEILAADECPYEKADLETFSDTLLGKTLKMLKPEESPFRAAASVARNDADAIPPSPAILLAQEGK